MKKLSSMSQKPNILFGPCGTRLKQIAVETGYPEIHDLLGILYSERAREAVRKVIGEYLMTGATIATTPAFGFRNFLHQTHGGDRLFRELLQEAHELVRSVVNGQGDRILHVVSLGPENDCYSPEQAPSIPESIEFHSQQVTEAQRLIEAPYALWFETVMTIQEAQGIALAAKRYNAPCIISFVLQRDGNLLSGENIGDAIRNVDEISGCYPRGYSLNCCAIEALAPALSKAGPFADRILALYPNASSRPQRELQHLSRVVTPQDPQGVARHLHALAKQYPHIQIIGGCCGFSASDLFHIHHAVQEDVFDNMLPKTDI